MVQKYCTDKVPDYKPGSVSKCPGDGESMTRVSVRADRGKGKSSFRVILGELHLVWRDLELHAELQPGGILLS